MKTIIGWLIIIVGVCVVFGGIYWVAVCPDIEPFYVFIFLLGWFLITWGLVLTHSNYYSGWSI